ncbi:MAG: hypothetical protein ACI8UO_002677, partial [Verrucomicrobiales bacterium]
RHDVIAVSINDPLEIAMPNVGLIELEDAETGELVQVDTGSAAFRKNYEGLGARRRGELNELFRSIGIDEIDVMTNRDYVRDLVKFFRARERKSRR